MSKKLITTILTGVVFMSNMHIATLPVKAANNSDLSVPLENIVYVSPNGNAENADGTIDDPFSTVEAARDYLRTKDIGKDSRGIIYLREGTYHVTNSISLTSEDSYVTYAAYKGESVEITGSATLENGKFKKLSEVSGEKYSSQTRLPSGVADKVYVYDLGAAGIPVGDVYKNGFNWTKQPPQPELIVNGELQILARYPNNGTITKSHLEIPNKGGVPRDYFFDKTDYSKTYEEMLAMNGPVFCIKNLPDSAHIWAGAYDYDNVYSAVNGDMPAVNPLNDNTKYETDGWLSGYFANEYGNDNVQMYSVRLHTDGKYYIYCKYPSLYGVSANSLKVSAINLLCELDSAGEYYIDRYNDNNVLYYYPQNGVIDNQSITLNAFDKPLVTMENAEGIQISGIRFTGTTNSGITMTDCELCTISGCELYNISMDAIKIGDNNGMITADSGYDTFGGGHNNTVANCVIHDMGHGGIYMAGGDRKSLERGNNMVKNCEFYNVSRLETYTPAIYLEGVGNTAQDNYIHDAPHMVIQIMGNDMLVTRNKIINTCYNANDMAPIYIGRDWTWLGNEISYNYIENVRYSTSTDFDFGIYMDDNASGVIIHHNIFNKIGGNAIYSNKGYGHYVVDNIVVDGTGPYYRYLTNGYHSWARPVPNEKSLKYRFYDILRTYDEAVAAGDESKEATKGYWNTQENINKWIEHYNTLYNELDEYSKKSAYAFDLGAKCFPTEGDNSSATWTDQNSIAAQANMTTVRNITVNTKDLWNLGGFYNNVNPSDAETYDVKRHKAASISALGLDLSTGKISSNSSLAKDANYGPKWIAEWNKNYSISEAGVSWPINKQHLWRKITEAEALLESNSELKSLLEKAHAAASDGLASQAEVDAAYNTLILNSGNQDVLMTDTIYVSPNGDDSNTGTKDSPLKTLAAAQRVARINSDGSKDVTVVLRGGEYNISDTLCFTSEDGGKNGRKVTWKGYESEIPVISGVTELTGWSIYDADKNIYCASVPEGFNTRQLYINGEKALRSRNISYSGNTYNHLKRTCELGLNSRNNREIYFYRDDIADWNNFENVEFHLITAWTDNVLRFAKYDKENNFKPTTVNNGGSEGVVDAAAVKLREPESTRLFNRAHPDITGTTPGYKSRSYYYLENAYEFIDEDNEWYLDTIENKIYCKAPAGSDMNDVRVTAPALETLINIDGSNQNRVCNLNFENIVFEGSTWTRPSEEGLVGGQASQYMLTSSLANKVTAYHTPSAFYAQYADSLNITGCTFRKIGSTAIDLYLGVTNSNIFGNEVYDTAGNGISVAKFFQDEDTEYHEAYNPTDKSEICENINVINNTVHDIGTEYEGAVAIAAGYPKNIVVAHNEVYNAPYSGISVGFGWTSKDNAMDSNIIFANRVHNVGLVSCDFGAIYTLSKQPQSLCARNYIYDLSQKPWYDYGYTAIYFDEQTEGYTIKENLTYNVGNNLWGNGINFNGCKAKNTATDNYLNTNPNSNEIVSAISAEAGIAAGKSCAELEAEAEQYIYDILHPEYNTYIRITPTKVSATAADSGSSAEYAIDGKADTVYTLSGQTANSMANQYLLIEFDGETPIDRIVIDRQYHAGGITQYDHWPDWCLAVGCELQGSFDGENWETIGVMNSYPEGTGDTTQDIYELDNPQAYKYVRYIRTKYKSGSDYGVWLWSPSKGGDGGNRLNVQDISFYSKTTPLPVTGSYDANTTTYTWTFANEPEGTDTAQSRNYETKDKIADLRLVLRSGDYVSNAAGIHFNDKSVGDSGSIQNSRYILVKPTYDGTLSATIEFPTAKSNVKCRLYAYDYGTGADFDSIDETLAAKGGTMATTPDITNANAATRTLNLQGGHTYAIYTYQRASNISALSYKVTEEIVPEPDTTPTPEPDVTPTPEPDVKQWVEAEITSVSADGISVNAKSNTNGEYKMITAVYDENGTLLSVKIRQVEFEKDVPREINVDIEVSGNVAVFFWKDEMTPVSEKIVYDDFDKDGLFPIMNYMKKISMN